jgi:hypothetical protein
MSVFRTATDSAFCDPSMGEDALWKPGGVGGVSCRIIRKSPDQVAGFGVSRALIASCVIDVRVSEIAAPAEGDLVVIGALSFKIIADPVIDSLGLVYSCEAAQA